MKVAWLLPTLLSSGAVSALGKLETDVGDKVLSPEGNLLLGKTGIIIQGQDTTNKQRSRDGAPIQSTSANTIPIDLDALNIVPPKNQTQPKFLIHQGEAPEPNARGDGPLVTLRLRNANTPSAPEDPESQDTEQPPESNPASTSASKAAETRNPASANRAIAGMGAGLVSVMLVFVVFL